MYMYSMCIPYLVEHELAQLRREECIEVEHHRH